MVFYETVIYLMWDMELYVDWLLRIEECHKSIPIEGVVILWWIESSPCAVALNHKAEKVHGNIYVIKQHCTLAVTCMWFSLLIFSHILLNFFSYKGSGKANQNM